MDKNEALRHIKNKFPNRVITGLSETNKYFIIETVDKRNITDDGTIVPTMDDGLKAIDKRTKEVFTYNPLLHGR